jgi:hypothetical protein
MRDVQPVGLRAEAYPRLSYGAVSDALGRLRARSRVAERTRSQG